MWSAALDGEPLDLQKMVDIFGEGDPKVSIGTTGDFVLDSSRFDGLNIASDVKVAADHLLTQMNGAVKVRDPMFRSVRLSGAFWKDKEMTRIVVPMTAEVLVTASGVAAGTVTVNGVLVDSPPPPEREWVARGEANRNVNDVLRRIVDRELDWATLYNIFEIMCEDLGDGNVSAGRGEIVERGWASGRRIKAFRVSANKETISGDYARHARTKGTTPTNTMTLNTGRAFILDLVQMWLAASLV